MMRKYTIDEGLRLLRSLARRRHRKTAIRDVEPMHDSRMAIGNSKGFCASSVSSSRAQELGKSSGSFGWHGSFDAAGRERRGSGYGKGLSR